MSYARSWALASVALALTACGASHDADDGSIDGSVSDAFIADLPFVHPDMPPIGDAGVDLSRPDASPHCFTGRACDPAVGCNGGQQCQDDIAATVNYSRADGTTAMVTVDYFVDGYCTNAPFGTPLSVIGATGACNPMLATDDPAMLGRDGCDSCAKCVKLRDESPSMPGIAMCLERCTPSATDNDICRDGYQCDPASHACSIAQCTTDTQCRLYRVDSNHDGMLDDSDATALDETSTATCNLETYRCVGSGSASGHAGDPCTTASMCESGGICLDELGAHLPGGYCTVLYCDLPGVTCGTGESCRDLGGGLHVCMRSCTVGAEAPTLVLGTGGHGDTCRAGYACLYDEHLPADSPGNGQCSPGTYNAITTPNVGAHCTMDSECWSPYGLGKCVTDMGQDLCTVIECAGFADPDGACGTGNVCEDVGDFSLCLHTCTTPDDCAAAIGGGTNLGCVALHPGGPTECFPGCQATSQCQPGLTCIGASLMSLGQCL